MREDGSRPSPEAAATEPGNLGQRSLRLLNEARYLSLATVSTDGRPWVATLEYAWLANPLRFVFGSAVGARHSRDIASSPRVGGSLFLTGGAQGVAIAAVDGAQFTGACAEITEADLDRYHSFFYESLFPDPRQRAQWSLPQSWLLPPAEHRLYSVEVERWWLIDTRTWEQDRIDRRVELPLSDLPLS